MSRTSLRLFALGALAAAGPACTLILGDFERGGSGTTSAGGGGATASSSSSSSSSSTTSSSGTGGGTTSSSSSGTGGGCSSDSDCPATGNECTTPHCDTSTHTCGTTNVAADTLLAQQTAGDCKKAVCDGNGGTTSIDDDSDVPDDGKSCTTDSCSGGMGVHTPITGSCNENGGKVCGGLGGAHAGDCVQCNVDADCTAPSLCDLTANNCVPPTCSNGMKDPGETDTDCGGPSCNPCGDGLSCSVGSDCTSQVCKTGKCQVPTCTDLVKNGSETGKDCGGSGCGPCPGGEGCKSGADCQSTVCNNGLCTAASCSDGIKNQGETDIDCGGPNCGPCDFGKICGADADCKGELCAAGKCSVKPLATGQNGPWGITNDGNKVYWVNFNGNSVASAPVAGGAVTVLATGTSGPKNIVRDGGTFVYWMGQNGLSRVPITGGALTNLYNFGSSDKADLTTDGVDVYFSRPCCQVYRYTAGSGTATSIYSDGGTSQITYVAPNILYWTTNNGIKKGTTSGASSTTILSLASNLVDLVADANAVYGAVPGPGGSINKLPNGSTTVVNLASGLADPQYLAVDASFVYWTDNNAGLVSKVPIGGGAPTVIASGQAGPMGITVTSTHVFWTNNTGGTVMRSLK
jgi:hypothetical protein